MDHESGQILVAENIDEKLPPASLTKIMTVYVVAHELKSGKIRFDDKVVVSENAWRMPGSRMFIEVEKEVSVEDLLKGVIVQSGNDASVALAEYVSGSEDVFANMMNQHVARLGLSGYCLVASAKRDNMRLISVVLGSDGTNARAKASQSLLNFGFRFYETHKLYRTNEVITSIKIWKGETDVLDLGIDHDLYITVPRGQYKHLDAAVEVDSTIKAPVEKGEKKGLLKVTLSGEQLVTDSLIALQSVSEGNLFNRLKDDVRLLFE
jgi:D-alanyl-D-alanine carboxypeptidase